MKAAAAIALAVTLGILAAQPGRTEEAEATGRKPSPEPIPNGVNPPKTAPAPKKPEDVAPPTAAEDPIQPGQELTIPPS